jgi:hypothetical protein
MQFWGRAILPSDLTSALMRSCRRGITTTSSLLRLANKS